MNKTVKKTSIFPAKEDIVFTKLKELKTLQYVAYPYATFSPQNGNSDMQWKEGEIFVFKFKLLGFIPFGTHTIRVKEFSEEKYTIYTHESNTYVPVWNHRISLSPAMNNSTLYTDEVELNAGWKTNIIFLWANCFYAHRQRKWIRLLSSEKEK